MPGEVVNREGSPVISERFPEAQNGEQEEISARPAPRPALEPFSEFFVSTATAGQYLAAGWVLRISFDFDRGPWRTPVASSGRGAGREGNMI